MPNPYTDSTIVTLTSPNATPELLNSVQTLADQYNSTVESYTVGDTPDLQDRNDVTLGVAIGGDGTFLEGVRLFSPTNIPMLAVNDGSLGFLARIHPDDFEDALTETLAQEADIIDREMLTANAPDLDAVGINDVMIEPTPPESAVDRKVATLHAYIDDEYLGEFTGSGLAVSTPTGSTAVALSAGGPIHYPNANSSLQLTPLHTHNMGVRPVIADGESTITIIPHDDVHVMVDGGRDKTILQEGQELCVTGADRDAKIVRTEYDETFFDALSGELGWGLRGVDDPGPHPR